MSLRPDDLPAALRERMGIPARSKYGVKGKDTRTADGITFDSKAEMHHYRDLVNQQKQGLIRYFHMQVPILLPGGVKYRVDFLVFYPEGREPHEEYHDVKGMRTDVYKVKRRIVEATYPFKIIEIRKGRR